jgi:cobalt-zinc-cadmium efflux system membrane fusion protein
MITVMKNRSFIHLILALGLFSFVLSCGQKEIAGDEEQDIEGPQGVVFTPEQVRYAKMKFGDFVEAKLSHDVYAKGKIKLPSDKLAEVNTTLGGIVNSIYVHNGEDVRKGQPLCRLVHPDIIQVQSDYLKARYDLSVAREHFERQKLLATEEVASQKAYQVAERDFLWASIHFKALKMNAQLAGFDMQSLDEGVILDHLDIRSPISGKVDDIYLHIGKFVEPGMPMFDVVDKSDLHAEIMVFERDIPYVKTGQRVTMSLSNISDEVFEGEVYTIYHSMEESARTIPIIVHFDKVPEDSYPGMFVSSTIHTGEDVYQALPEEAIVAEKDDENYIYYTLDDPISSEEIRFEKIQVHPLLIEDGYASVALLDSLPPNAHIVLEGGYYIRSMYIRSLD